MLKRIKTAFITLGIASGMTAAALFYFHNVPQCRAMVLTDLAATQSFQAALSDYQQTGDFLATLAPRR